MNGDLFSEFNISQKPALELLQKMGYTYISPEECDIQRGSLYKVLLKGILREQLKKLNKVNFGSQSMEFSSANIEKAIEDYKKLGAEIVEVSLPKLKYSIGIYYILATAECSSNLARFDGVRYGHRTKDAQNLLEMYTKTRAEGFGDEVKRRIMLGTYALSSGYYDAYYKKAQQLRRLVKNDFDKVFEDVDILISPTCPTTAFDIGSRNEDPLAMYLTDIATISANLIGAPALSTPCGFDSEKMPIGLQIIGKNLDEATVLKAAYNLEQAIK